jgi:hypothetical protein
VIPAVKPIDKMNAVQVRGIQASAVPQPENPPLNMFDGGFGTRYAVQGKGQWVTFDFGAPTVLDTMAISIYNGNTRQQYFNISVSDNGEEFAPIYENGVTSGKTTGLELFSFKEVKARYLRVELNESSASDWNSVTEIAFGTKR